MCLADSPPRQTDTPPGRTPPPPRADTPGRRYACYWNAFLFCSIEYKKEILYPVLSSVARRYGQGDLYEGMINNEEPLVIPKGVSEFEVRLRQVSIVSFVEI